MSVSVIHVNALLVLKLFEKSMPSCPMAIHTAIPLWKAWMIKAKMELKLPVYLEYLLGEQDYRAKKVIIPSSELIKLER
jgi:hypothetical protein